MIAPQDPAETARERERARIRALIADLETHGLTIYKISLLANQQYNTVKHWKQTGRVESHDAAVLESIHLTHCPRPGNRCLIEPQYCKVLTIST